MIPNPQDKLTTPSVVSYTRKASANASSAQTASKTGDPSEKAGNGNPDNGNDAGVTLAAPVGSSVASEGGVTFGDAEETPGVLVGAPAMERIPIDPRNTYSSVKRVMGRTLKEAKEAGVSLGALNVDQVKLEFGLLGLGLLALCRAWPFDYLAALSFAAFGLRVNANFEKKVF